MKLNKNTMIYNVTMLSISSILLQMLGTIYRIIIARLIGAEGMGVFSLIMPFYMILIAICFSGLTVAVSRITAEEKASNDKLAIRKLVSKSKGIFIITLIFVSIITITFLDEIANDILGDGRTKEALIGVLICLFFTGIENIYKSYFFGIKNVHPPIISELLEQTVRIIAVTSLLYYLHPKDGGLSATLIIIGMIISEVVSSFCMKVFYEKSVPIAAYRPKIKNSGMLKMILVIAVPVAFGGLVNNLLAAANTVLIPQRLVVSGLSQQHALEILGILFGMVLPLLMLPSVFVGSLSTIIMPTLSQGMAQNDHADIKRKVIKAFRATGIITFPTTAIMIALGSELCFVLYGQADTRSYIIPLAIASLFVYFQIISGSILNGLGMQKIATINIVITGLLQLSFTYYLTSDPRFGIYGYIAGFLISDILLMIMNMFFVLKKIKLKVIWGGWFVLPAISSAFMGIIARMAYVYIMDSGFNQSIALFCSISIGLLIYVVLLRVEGIKMMRYVKSMISI